jgi:hypothetical protein
MMHLGVFYTVLREPSPLKLPIEVLATIFKHMSESNFRIGVLKKVKEAPSYRHKHQVSEAKEVWSSADNDATRL